MGWRLRRLRRWGWRRRCTRWFRPRAGALFAFYGGWHLFLALACHSCGSAGSRAEPRAGASGGITRTSLLVRPLLLRTRALRSVGTTRLVSVACQAPPLAALLGRRFRLDGMLFQLDGRRRPWLLLWRDAKLGKVVAVRVLAAEQVHRRRRWRRIRRFWLSEQERGVARLSTASRGEARCTSPA